MNGSRRTTEACGCCGDNGEPIAVNPANRPGLQSLAYRVGTHGSFKSAMLARIARQRGLHALTARDDADFTVGLIDAWATVCDVLSFYTERIANEGHLRTATERLSVQTLARSIGYEPHPGVAASTYLTFTVEDSPGAPADMPIPAGTRAQSNPDGDALPQTFETTQELIARPEWNALRPRRREPQRLTRDSRVFWIEGTATGLSVGDFMLLRAGESIEQSGPISSIPLRILAVEPDQEAGHTRVETERPQTETPTTTIPPTFEFSDQVPPPPPSSLYTETFTFSGTNAATLATEFTWSAADSELFALMHFDTAALFASYVNHAVVEPGPAQDTTLYALRAKTAPFGHNAPRYDTLPADWIQNDDIGNIAPNDVGPTPYPLNWDAGRPVDETSAGTPYKEAIYGASDEDDEVILLDAQLTEVLPDGWILLKSTDAATRFAAYRVVRADTVSRADFALNGQVTALTLREADAEQLELSDFTLRATTIFAQSEDLTLAGSPIETPVEGDAIELDHMLESQIHPGQLVIVSGTPTDLQDLIESELAIVSTATHRGGHTRLRFEQPLARRYRRNSVRLSANVTPATHGEAQNEVLGGGDASRPFQAFKLSQPLTYVSAPVPGGAQSTLELRVNGQLWREGPRLYGLGPDERRYVLRRDVEDKTTVLFGDGRSGGRLPSGFDNVTARYRSGLGLAGNLAAGKISLLGSQPRYVQSVNNPLPATGGADPETQADTRRRAPGSVRTLGRIVSLSDFEDFAIAFGGIAKARADLLHATEGELVHLTLAGEAGAPVAEDSDLFTDLLDAMNRVRDPSVRLILASYTRRFFDVVAGVRVQADYESAPVLSAAEAALREAFSFGQRDLGRDVSLGELVANLQGTRGVVAVDLDRFRLSHEQTPQTGVDSPFTARVTLGIPTRLRALPARQGSANRIRPAQHLSLKGIQLTEM